MRSLFTPVQGFLLALLVFGPQIAWSQTDWPKQPVRLVVPFPAGGGYDIMARAVGQRLSLIWGQPVLVENRSGGNEIIAAEYVVKAAPDGYTILFGSGTGLVTNHILYSNLPYDPRTQFVPITRVAQGPIVYVVRGDSPYDGLPKLVEAAKAAPEKVSYGSSGTGGSVHIEVNWLGTAAGVRFLHVPYQGLAAALKDVMSGSIDFTAVPLAAASALIKAGRLKAVAVSSTSRLPSMPGVPTTTELYAGTEYAFMMGLAAPARTPSRTVEKIAADVKAVLASADFIAAQFEPYGYLPVGDSPRDFSAYLASFYATQEKRVRAANITIK